MPAVTSSKRLPQPADRGSLLSARRNAKMARSAHAYVRGSTLKFYEWLDALAPDMLPQGPSVWICGDCHLGNFGPVADGAGNVELLVRDFDQAVIGNPVHDLIRLGLSLAMAARGSDLSGTTTARMLEQMIEAYVDVCTKRVHRPARKSRIVDTVLMDARRRGWKHLAQERSENALHRLPLGKRFWPLSAKERSAIETLVSDPTVRHLATLLERRADGADVELLDAAYWVKGCSSLGRLRYAVLLDVDGEASRQRDFCLIDIKEAARALAPRSNTHMMPRDNGERVLSGARAMSPYLGERMVPGRFLDRSVILRELLPEDLKIEVERLSTDQAVKIARSLAQVIGRAHTRQLDAGQRRAWGKELTRNHPKSIEMPSWLWSSVIDLIATHERAYLEHCRRLTFGC